MASYRGGANSRADHVPIAFTASTGVSGQRARRRGAEFVPPSGDHGPLKIERLEMCGIAALFRVTDSEPDGAVIEKMTDAVAHRGPDGSGIDFYRDSADGIAECKPAFAHDWRIALGHRRLSILDLSDAGRQPMSYRGRLWITFNGEIYNYVELRRELERLGHEFHSQTDTEVILAAYDEWGTDCFERLRGMWGLVLIDGPRRMAVVSRDRLGIKPVYFAKTTDLIAIASEIKQFAAMPGFAVRSRMNRSYAAICGPATNSRGRTFFAGVVPLPEGTWQTIDLKTGDDFRTASSSGIRSGSRSRSTIPRKPPAASARHCSNR